jgi:hypothetical protein
VIIHAATTKLFAVDSGTILKLIPAGTYPSMAIWTTDTSVALQSDLNGFFLHPLSATPVTLSLMTPNTLSLGPSSDSGCRFIHYSSYFHFTNRLSLLKPFIASRAPFLCYAKGAVMPIIVEAYLPSSIFIDRSNPSSPVLQATANKFPTSSGD